MGRNDNSINLDFSEDTVKNYENDICFYSLDNLAVVLGFFYIAG